MSDNDVKLFRLMALCGTLCFLTLTWGCIWLDATNERMALQGFMPLRLQGENAVYWLPIPTDKPSDQLKEMLKH